MIVRIDKNYKLCKKINSILQHKMKTLFLSIAFFMACSGAFAQEVAHINFDVKKHDFGKIYHNQDSVVTFTFYFENTANVPLLIQKVTTSCGCTVPEWTKSPVEKNQKGFVKVMFNAKAINGNFSKSIYVKSNADNDVVILRIVGEVLDKKSKSIFDIFK